jgi:hypothetical protein
MPVNVPVPAVVAGNIYTPTMYNNYLKDNLNKLLNTGHRTLTVAQFGALTGLEGTKGVVAGDEVYLEVDAANGVLWHLVYESTETTYKWRYLGGPPLMSMVDASETTASATYVDLTTVGPSLTLQRGGDYDAAFGANLIASATGGAVMSPKLAAATASDTDGVTVTTNGNASVSRNRRFAGRAASDVIKLQARSGAGTATFLNRFLYVMPVRIL